MRILMVSNTYLPAINGVTVTMGAWVDALRGAGHDVAVWTVAGRDPGLEGVYATRGFGTLVAGFPYPTTFRPPTEVRTFNAEVVHVHHPVLLGRAAIGWARRHRIPVVATAHSDYLHYLDFYGWRPGRRIAGAVGRRLMRDAFDHCDAALAPSTAIARRLADWGVSAPIVPTDYAVDPERLGCVERAEARMRLGLSREMPLAFYAGRLAVEKGLEILLAEWEHVLDSVPDAVLALAGGGPLESRLHERLVARGLTERVRLLGELHGHGLGLWYAAADCFVSASVDEVGPMTAIEALLCATPVVAYAGPGYEDRVVPGESGLLAESKAGALAEALSALLGDRERAAKMGVRGQAASIARYEPATVAAMLERTYADVIASRAVT